VRAKGAGDAAPERRPDSGESRLGTRKGTGPTVGARLSAAERGKGGGGVGLGRDEEMGRKKKETGQGKGLSGRFELKKKKKGNGETAGPVLG